MKDINPSLIIVMQLKGGVGKSTITKLTYQSSVDEFGEDSILLVDADSHNKSVFKAYPEKALLLNLSIKSHCLKLATLGEENQGKIILVDFPAGDAKEIQSIFGSASDVNDFLESYKDAGFSVKVAIPVSNDAESNAAMSKIYDIFHDSVEYFLVKNLRPERDETKYADAFKIFEGEPRRFAEDVLKIETMVQAPDIDDPKSLVGYTSNCILLPCLADEVKEKLSVGEKGEKTEELPLSEANLAGLQSIYRREGMKFFTKMKARILASNLLK